MRGMKFRNLVVAATIPWALLLLAAGSNVDYGHTSTVPSIWNATMRATVEGHPSRVQEAFDRFQAAGLLLPPSVTVTVATRGVDCDLSYTRRRAVTICLPEPADLDGSYVYEHELAHVWVQFHLPRSEREAFMAEFGGESWNNKNHDWHYRGTERAAIAIERYANGTLDYYAELGDDQRPQVEWLLARSAAR